MSPRVSHSGASSLLAERDQVMATLLDAAGPMKLRRPFDTHFAALVRSVVYQQLAGRAAAAIHNRLIAALHDDVAPAALLRLSDEEMRAAGLSANKTASLRDLSVKVLDGTVVLDPRRLAREEDQEVIARLSAVRGIGEWTAQMFLLFQLRRLDVWPTGDLGVRRGYGLAYGIDMPSPRELAGLGDRFRPYRSVAAWYCWRACDIYLGGAGSEVTR